MKSVSKSFLLSLVFVSNLSLGSHGHEVVTLQQFLESKGYLSMPPGVSYGYFGPLTKTAVSRWQEDNGISPAAGYFGPISRGVYNNMAPIPSAAIPQSGASTTQATSTFSSFVASVAPDTLVATGMRANRVVLFQSSPFEVRPGDEIVLNGSGFSKTLNKVYFNGTNPVEATSTNGATMKLIVPTNLSEGEVELSVSNILGSSENPLIKVLIKVTNNPQSAPVIESAAISGDTVTLVGKGFTSSNNLFTSLGNSSNPVSSNGTTLSFSITSLSWYEMTKTSLKGQHYKMTLWIYVQNEQGVTANPYKLEMII